MSSTILDRNGGTSSTSAAVDRNTGLSTSAAVKAPVRSLSTTAITLSGEQTVAGVALVSGDRCAVGGQADSTLNGIYIVSTGTWTRTPDFSRNDDVFNGTLVVVGEGTNAGIWGVVTSVSPAVIGTTHIAISAFSAIAGYASLASPAFTGNPTAPTATVGDNDLSIANTAFVTAADTAVLAAAIAAIVNSAPANLTTLIEIATSINNDPAFYTTMTAYYAQAKRAGRIYMNEAFGAT